MAQSRRSHRNPNRGVFSHARIRGAQTSRALAGQVAERLRRTSVVRILRERLARTGAVRLLRTPRRADELEARLLAFEGGWLESVDELRGRSRIRWRAAQPNSHLTWGKTISGQPFVSKVAEFGGFGSTRTVLEIGPGYGRVLQACIERGDDFQEYLAVDLSPDNVNYLQQQFPQANISFLRGDIETINLGRQVDTVISSLTFKHLFPSFEQALQNVARHLSPGGVVIFDLIEGHRRYFEDDGVTYIRCYTRDEVKSILAAVGLELATLDQVRHLPDFARLLVVARMK